MQRPVMALLTMLVTTTSFAQETDGHPPGDETETIVIKRPNEWWVPSPLGKLKLIRKGEQPIFLEPQMTEALEEAVDTCEDRQILCIGYASGENEFSLINKDLRKIRTEECEKRVKKAGGVPVVFEEGKRPDNVGAGGPTGRGAWLICYKQSDHFKTGNYDAIATDLAAAQATLGEMKKCKKPKVYSGGECIELPKPVVATSTTPQTVYEVLPPFDYIRVVFGVNTTVTKHDWLYGLHVGFNMPIGGVWRLEVLARGMLDNRIHAWAWGAHVAAQYPFAREGGWVFFLGPCIDAIETTDGNVKMERYYGGVGGCFRAEWKFVHIDLGLSAVLTGHKYHISPRFPSVPLMGTLMIGFALPELPDVDPRLKGISAASSGSETSLSWSSVAPYVQLVQ